MADTELTKHDSQNTADPYERRSVQIAPPLPPLGGTGGGPEQYAPDGHSHPGMPLPSRPARAVANGQKFKSSSVTLKGYIEPPCG